MPEVQDAVGGTAGEAGPEDHVGPAGEYRRHQNGILGRVVFEVRVLDDHEVARGCLDPGSQRRSLPLVDRVIEDLVHAARRLDDGLEALAGAVGGAIVDDDDLLVDVRRRANRIDHLVDRVHFVVAGDDDG